MEMDDLVARMGRDLVLTPSEEREVLLNRPPVTLEGKLFPLFCKITILRKVNDFGFISAMRWAWDLLPVQGNKTNEDVYCFLVSSRLLLDQVLARLLWSYDGQIQVDFVGLMPEAMVFFRVAFWILVLGLPVGVLHLELWRSMAKERVKSLKLTTKARKSYGRPLSGFASTSTRQNHSGEGFRLNLGRRVPIVSGAI